MPPHTDPAVLVDYALGRLNQRAAAKVRAHCLRCVECGGQLAAAIALRVHVGVADEPSVDWRRVAAAAVVVLAVGIAAIGFVGDGIDVRGMAPGVETVAEESAPAVDASGTSRASAEDLADFDRRVRMLRRALGTLARASTDVDRETRIRVALEHLTTGDLAGMAEALEPFEERYDPWGTVLLGISRYLDGDTGPDTVAYLNAAYERAILEGREPGESYLERVGAFYLARLERDRGRAQRADDILLALLPYKDALSADASALLAESGLVR